MKKNLEILDYEDKKTDVGKRFVRFKTRGNDYGDKWMSCFDKKASDELKKWEDKEVCVDVVESGNFVNIKKFIGRPTSIEDSGALVDNEEVEVVKPGTNVLDLVKDERKHTTMYTSYAKDIFCALLKSVSEETWDKYGDKAAAIKTMNLSIELVKQAKEAFE